MPGRNLDFSGFPVSREAHEIRQIYVGNILLEVYWAWLWIKEKSSCPEPFTSEILHTPSFFVPYKHYTYMNPPFGDYEKGRHNA